MQEFLSFETVLHSQKTVILGESEDFWRDPWFDKLTTLSEVEGESRELVENQTIPDPPPLPVGNEEFPHGPVRERSLRDRILGDIFFQVGQL